MIQQQCFDKFYQNTGNILLLALIPSNSRVLDCGCGAGDNARVLRARGCQVTGITISPSEMEIASAYCDKVILANLEEGLPKNIGDDFDVIMMSHVLEHLIQPQKILQDAHQVLAPDGILAVALPNALHYSVRLKFLRGKFDYTDSGILDNTHVRFYTYESGRRLIEQNGYNVYHDQSEGTFFLWKLRGLFPGSFVRRLNRRAGQAYPGLFSYQSIYLARLVE